jgi:RNA polymerase subunit RPABC4/transcription elongation factor Spt4
LRFDADDAVICPRCSSKSIDKVFEKKRDYGDQPGQEREQAGPRVAYSTNRHVYSETKAGWASFHSSEMRACPDCGGADFDLNWKRKEKTCKKCGSVFPLGRRTA